MPADLRFLRNFMNLVRPNGWDLGVEGDLGVEFCPFVISE